MDYLVELFNDEFNHFDENSDEMKFANCFSEFIDELSQVDLSRKTVINLYEIFMKDTKVFFKK